MEKKRILHVVNAFSLEFMSNSHYNMPSNGNHTIILIYLHIFILLIMFYVTYVLILCNCYKFTIEMTSENHNKRQIKWDCVDLKDCLNKNIIKV